MIFLKYDAIYFKCDTTIYVFLLSRKKRIHSFLIFVLPFLRFLLMSFPHFLPLFSLYCFLLCFHLSISFFAYSCLFSSYQSVPYASVCFLYPLCFLHDPSFHPWYLFFPCHILFNSHVHILLTLVCSLFFTSAPVSLFVSLVTLICLSISAKILSPSFCWRATIGKHSKPSNKLTGSAGRGSLLHSLAVSNPVASSEQTPCRPPCPSVSLFLT